MLLLPPVYFEPLPQQFLVPNKVEPIILSESRDGVLDLILFPVVGGRTEYFASGSWIKGLFQDALKKPQAVALDSTLYS